MTALTPLCVENDLIVRYGPTAVNNWADQQNNGTEFNGTVSDAILWASGELYGRLGQQYAVTDLQSSDIVKRWCITLSSYYLSTTRGNPAPEAITNEYERVMAQINEVIDLWSSIPGISRAC